MKLLTLGGGREVELLTIDEVAKSLGQHPETIRRAIWGGHLGSIKLGGRLFVRREQIDDYITRCTRPRSAEAIKRGRGRPWSKFVVVFAPCRARSLRLFALCRRMHEIESQLIKQD